MSGPDQPTTDLSDATGEIRLADQESTENHSTDSHDYSQVSAGHASDQQGASSTSAKGSYSGSDYPGLPQDRYAEESVLGAMMLSTDAIAPAIELLTGAHFFYKPNAYIFDAIAALYATGVGVDYVTVAEELASNNVLDQAGGVERLLALQRATPLTTRAGTYARSVEEKALLRSLHRTGIEISDLARSDPRDVPRALDEAEGLVYAVAERRIINSTSHLKGLLEDALEHLEDIYENGDGITGSPTGFDELDKILGGLQHSTLNVVGARPSMGKTAFALTVASHIAVTVAKPVLFFSLEMAHLELTNRLLAADARIDSQKLQTGKLETAQWTKITNSIERLGQAQLWIDDNPNLTIPEIRAKSRRLARQTGEDLGLIVVDYLQLMSGRMDSESRQVEVAEMSRGLKVLARELRTPVLALSQLSRQLEQRSDKRPMLSDLRESGAIEQDADVVMFLYRDEIYNADSPDKGSAEVIVAKHRNGPIGKANLAFLPQYARFVNAGDRTAASGTSSSQQDY